MRIRNLLCVSAIGAGLAGVAWADWNPGDPYKMERPMLPDEATGRDVAASYVRNPQEPQQPFWNKIVADDWRCSETGPITDSGIRLLQMTGDVPRRGQSLISIYGVLGIMM